MTGEQSLFAVDRLSVHFRRKEGIVRAVQEVSLKGYRGQTIGIVGESGSGKTTLARALLLLTPITSGTVFLEGQDLRKLKPKELRSLRKRMQMVFQDPDGTFNPRKTVGWHLDEVFLTHFPSKTFLERKDLIAQTLHTVQLDTALLGRYPYELSGGQKQRFAIARALLTSPDLMVLDEPLSSLDASLRKSTLELLKQLQERFGMCYVFITHDLSTLSAIATQVVVMYQGSIVEACSVNRLYTHPTHPYTKALLSCIPVADPRIERARNHLCLSKERKPSLPDYTGCSFASRCPSAQEKCLQAHPCLTAGVGGHFVACHQLPPSW